MARNIQYSFTVDDIQTVMDFVAELTEQDEKLYLWSLLGSKVRAAIKAEGKKE